MTPANAFYRKVFDAEIIGTTDRDLDASAAQKNKPELSSE